MIENKNNSIQRHSFDIFKKSHKIFIEGHRGVNRKIFQNTIDSYKEAIKYNLDSIEIDVWLTKDKIPIVIHGGFLGSLHSFIKNAAFFDFPDSFSFQKISNL